MNAVLARFRTSARLRQALRQLQRLGLPAALAAALTLLTVAGAIGLQREQGRLEAERRDLAARRASLAPRTPAAPPAEGGAALAASLPPDSARQARTAALLALAAETGLPWPRSDFRYQADRELGLAQYRVAMQLTGRYEALRRYIGEALRRDPALALDSVRLRREADGQVKADLGWVLHMQGPK